MKSIEPGTNVIVKKGTPIFDVKTGSRITTQSTRFLDAGVAPADVELLFVGYQQGKGTRASMKMALFRRPDFTMVAVEASKVAA